jgi:hypothetical protein
MWSSFSMVFVTRVKGLLLVVYCRCTVLERVWAVVQKCVWLKLLAKSMAGQGIGLATR